MQVLLTGASGALGRKYLELFPETTPISIRYNNRSSFFDLQERLKSADVLIHASANLNPKSIDDAIRDNAILPFDILEAASEVNPNVHIILISSMSLLGENGEPRRLRDMTPYAASKFIMEEMSQKVSRNPITIVRFSTIFYADHSRDGLSKIVYTAYKARSIVASDCRRDFIPLWAACTWLEKLCGNKKWYNKTINIASGKSINMLDVASHLVRKYGVAFHHTSLPDYSSICYNFDSSDPQSLEPITFDIYQLVNEYYEQVKKESNEQTTKY